MLNENQVTNSKGDSVPKTPYLSVTPLAFWILAVVLASSSVWFSYYHGYQHRGINFWFAWAACGVFCVATCALIFVIMDKIIPANAPEFVTKAMGLVFVMAFFGIWILGSSSIVVLVEKRETELLEGSQLVTTKAKVTDKVVITGRGTPVVRTYLTYKVNGTAITGVVDADCFKKGEWYVLKYSGEDPALFKTYCVDTVHAIYRCAI